MNGQWFHTWIIVNRFQFKGQGSEWAQQAILPMTYITITKYKCDCHTHRNRPVGYFNNNNERSWEQIIKINVDNQSCAKSLFFVGFLQIRHHCISYQIGFFIMNMKSQFMFLETQLVCFDVWCDGSQIAFLKLLLWSVEILPPVENIQPPLAKRSMGSILDIKLRLFLLWYFKMMAI